MFFQQFLCLISCFIFNIHHHRFALFLKKLHVLVFTIMAFLEKKFKTWKSSSLWVSCFFAIIHGVAVVVFLLAMVIVFMIFELTFVIMKVFIFHDVGIFGNGNGGCNGLVCYLFFSFCKGCHPQDYFFGSCSSWCISYCCSFAMVIVVMSHDVLLTIVMFLLFLLQWLSLSCVLLANISLAMVIVIVMFFLLQ